MPTNSPWAMHNSGRSLVTTLLTFHQHNQCRIRRFPSVMAVSQTDAGERLTRTARFICPRSCTMMPRERARGDLFHFTCFILFDHNGARLLRI
eukprot:6212345-Pleurochrysis_carterae.AAC.2